MKKFLFLLSLISCLFINNLVAQNFLPLEWRFKTGDNLEWGKPTFDDHDWKLIKIDNSWENQGYKDFDGYAWYRTQITIPVKYKKSADKYGGLLLRFPNIDDSDMAYWNGECIGVTGEFPPHYQSGYGKTREYIISANKIEWDKPNTIAVRVYDGTGDGGIYGGVSELLVKGAAENFKIDVPLQQKDHIIREKQNVVILPLEFNNKLKERVSGKVTMKLVDDFGKEYNEIVQNVSVSSKTKLVKKLSVENLSAGFYTAHILFEGKDMNQRFTYHFGLEPEKIISPLDRESDFDDFWDRAKRELAAVDPQFKLTKIDSLGSKTKDVYLLEMRSLGNILVRGWYCVPKKAGVYPAILQVQGYSSNQLSANRVDDDDFINLLINIRGHGNSKDDFNPGFPGYLQYFLDDKELYVYRGAYMDCIRAVDFLFSRKEVDQTKVIVEGGSQGGALSFATAALDNKRIRLCVPMVPFLSDFKDYFKVAVWPGNEFTKYVNEHPLIGWDKVYKTLSYFDIKNLAPWIKAPVRMSVGLVDITCPPHINFAAYNQLSVPKEYEVFPFSGHGLPSEASVNNQKWIRKQLGMTE